MQPPSGGCVLKLFGNMHHCTNSTAAFGRLCVETRCFRGNAVNAFPAAFGRLCVETTQYWVIFKAWAQPPSGGCVLKLYSLACRWSRREQPPSGGCVLKLVRLGRSRRYGSAAFGRLCVETIATLSLNIISNQPPSGGCVLKHSDDLAQTIALHQPPSGGCVLKHK